MTRQAPFKLKLTFISIELCNPRRDRLETHWIILAHLSRGLAINVSMCANQFDLIHSKMALGTRAKETASFN